MKSLAESRILIVDDAAANVDVLVNLLRADYRLSVALDGEAALRAIAKAPPDLVLLDIMMPELDGYAVCRRMRDHPAWREIPVMFLSSLEEVTDKARGFEAGGNDYVTKPFEPLEVQARVRSLLRARAYSVAVREAHERDLRIAREIQMGLLHADLRPFTQGTGLDVAAVVEPASFVGGDLYDVIRVDDRVVVALGDVSGKGLPAALFMAVTLTLLRTMSRLYEDPAEILSRLNDELAEQNPRGMFVTMQCAVFDLSRGRVTVAGAGHHSAVVLSATQPPRLAFPSSGRVAGIAMTNEMTSESMDLRPGDTLLFFSDGVTEAFDASEGLLGEEELLSQLTTCPGLTAAETVRSVLAAVSRHVGDAKQSDDITVVASRWCPARANGEATLPGRS
jgi:serine phosphatase RsbU (regulator of sigma subunit)